MIPATTMLACPNLATPPALMYHMAQVESHFNRFAIGVVGGRLERQPDSLDEAVATAQMLETKGYNFSVGLAQVNRDNLRKYGLDTYTEAFSICDNLRVGSRILAQCYANAHGAWGKAFSCYYAGNYTTGFRDGYVQKVFATFNPGTSIAAGGPAAAHAIPVVPAARGDASRQTATAPANGSAYRIAIRSTMSDAIASALAAPVVNAIAEHQASDTSTQAQPASPHAAPEPASAAGSPAANDTIFVPQVTGPGESSSRSPHADTVAATTQSAAAPASSSAAADDAFVF